MYPTVGAIIIGERNFGDYNGRRFSYEWACCWLGWSLAQLNPMLREQKGLLQRATEHVTSFLFEGCISRTNQSTYQDATTSEQPQLDEWKEYMLPFPDWLPGLSQNQDLKNELQILYEESQEVYERHLYCCNRRSPKALEEASYEAVEFYFEQANLARLREKIDKKIADVGTFFDRSELSR